jgi:serine/threonine protein kinase
LFSAKRLDTEAHVIVKFCSRYNSDVHLYCFRCGFAPALISYTTLGNYKVVVMEKLNNLRALTRDDLKKSEILQQIRAILSKLKEKNYVHGDFRRCNILVDTGSNRVFLVDFDWSGIDGEVKYPPLMNSHITWPEGANTGELIRHEHDVYWLDHFFDDVLPPF